VTHFGWQIHAIYLKAAEGLEIMAEPSTDGVMISEDNVVRPPL
jgi:hypothetical protein